MMDKAKGLILIEKYIPKRYREATTDNQVALDWIREPKGVLYLTGPNGTGKSHTAWAIIREYLIHDAVTYPYQPLVGGSVNTVLESMKPGQVPDDERGTLLDPKRQAAKCPLLFLDDLGASKITDWADETLFYILDTRYNEMLPTLIASNVLPGAELVELIGNRIVDRIAEEATVVPMVGESVRRSGLIDRIKANAPKPVEPKPEPKAEDYDIELLRSLPPAGRKDLGAYGTRISREDYNAHPMVWVKPYKDDNGKWVGGHAVDAPGYS